MLTGRSNLSSLWVYSGKLRKKKKAGGISMLNEYIC